MPTITDSPSLIDSSLQTILTTASQASSTTLQPDHLYQLAAIVRYNLQYQHDWTQLSIHTTSDVSTLHLPRPLISGLPPRRAYVHPDEQAEILKAEHKTGKSLPQVPEQEWVLPTHLGESWSLKKFAEVFDAIPTLPPCNVDDMEQDNDEVGAAWRGSKRQKRVLLATVHDDSTIVYYIVHDGIVKPRQN